MKSFKFLLGCIIFLSLVALMMWMVSESERKSTGGILFEAGQQKLLSSDVVINAETIEISTKAAPNPLVFLKSSPHWLIANNGKIRADFNKLRLLLKDLAEADLVRVASSKADEEGSLYEIGSEGTFSLKKSNGDLLWSVSLGKSDSSGRTFLRIGGENRILLANLRVFLDASPEAWIERKILPFDQQQIRDVTVIKTNLSNPKDLSLTISAGRESAQKPWVVSSLPDTLISDSVKVDGFIRKLTDLRYTTIDSKPFTGFKAPAVILFTLFNGESYRIELEQSLQPPAKSTTATPKAKGKNEPASPESSSVPLRVILQTGHSLKEGFDATQFNCLPVTLKDLPESIQSWTLPKPPEPEAPPSK